MGLSWGLVVAACLLSFASGELELVVIHTNDMHARLDEISGGGGICGPSAECYGGFARIKAAADKARSENENVLFLNGGDSFQGSPYYTVYKWKIIAQFVDMLGIDVMSLGNHEFDDGVKGLAPYLATVRTPTVSTNIDTSLEPDLNNGTNLHAAYNLTVAGVPITVIGYLTPDTVVLASTGKVKFSDEVESLSRAAKKAREEGAKLVFAIGHSGYDMDCKIAKEAEGIDLVVGGHTNTFLYTGTPPDQEVPASVYPHIEKQASGKEVPVVQAFAWTKYLGFLRLKFNDDYELVSYSGNPILMDSSKPKDPLVEAELSKWREKLADNTNVYIGKTSVDLSAGNCRMAECTMGNLITDIIYDYGSTKAKEFGWPQVPIALLNSGGIRASIFLNDTNGNITAGSLLTVLPFENRLRVLKVNGSMVKEVFEFSVGDFDPTGVIQKGRFLVISGARVLYDINEEPGHRVKSLSILSDGEYHDFDINKEYYIILPEFVASGGDGYGMLKDLDFLYHSEDGLTQMVTDYINKNSPVAPALDGRISFTTEEMTSGSTTPKPFLSTVADLLR